MTLEDLLTKTDAENVQEAVKTLGKFLESQNDDKLKTLNDTFVAIADSNKALGIKLDSLMGIMQKILERPDPIYPEQKDFPTSMEVSMKKPDWYKEPESTSWDNTDVIRAIKLEGKKTQALLAQLLEQETSETDEPEKSEDTKTVGAVRSRRITQWKVATYPQVTGTSSIVSAGDNHTYYLPSAVIQNSETVRLNNGSPSAYGTDYTLSGNKIVFVQDQTGSTFEIRYQTR